MLGGLGVSPGAWWRDPDSLRPFRGGANVSQPLEFCAMEISLCQALMFTSPQIFSPVRQLCTINLSIPPSAHRPLTSSHFHSSRIQSSRIPIPPALPLQPSSLPRPLLLQVVFPVLPGQSPRPLMVRSILGLCWECLAG